jgi:hypothetical protein
MQPASDPCEAPPWREAAIAARRSAAGETCRTVAEWRVEIEREQDHATKVAEDAYRRDRKPQ